MLVSAIVCAHSLDSYQDLMECVDSLLGQTHKPLEIIVVIDGNTALHEKVTADCAQHAATKTVLLERSKGISGARNAGIRAAGGEVSEKSWTIPVQEPEAAPLEVCFEGLWPSARKELRNFEISAQSTFSTSFEGAAFVIDGGMKDRQGEAECEVRVDGRLVERVTLSGDYHDRRTPLFWSYDLEQGTHELEVKKLGGDGVPVLSYLLVYNKNE